MLGRGAGVVVGLRVPPACRRRGLSGVAVIDSSGVATFLEAYQGARKNEETFVLAAVGETVLRVLKLARLDGVFTLADGVAEGLRARD